MGHRRRFPAVFKVGLWILLLSSLSACQNGLTSYRGNTVDAKNRFDLLEGGPHQGSWQTRDLLVEFRYLRERQDLQISGLLTPQDYLLHFDLLKYLFFRVHFVDAGGKALADEALLMSAGYRVELPEKMAFKANLKIPRDSAAIAFSYMGSALFSGEPSRASGWDFWKGP